MIDPVFREVGASGRRYGREYVLEVLEERARSRVPEAWATREFDCLEIAPSCYLVTYTLTQGARVTLRSTIWRQTPEGWRALYHQGTVAEKEGG